MHTASIDSGRQCASLLANVVIVSALCASIRLSHPQRSSVAKNEHENPDFVLVFYIFAAFRHEIAQIVSELRPSSLLVSEDVFKGKNFHST